MSIRSPNSSTAASSGRHIPLKPEVKDRKAKFAALNEYIRQRNGWMVSVPGDPAMRFQTLPGSPLPDQLTQLGYIVTETGKTERILPHSGIVTVAEFDLRMP
jgi:hypothetical protein